jgi:hypothetical protein
MTKINLKKQNNYDPVINLIEKELKKRKINHFSQEELLDFLDKKKLMISEKEMDEFTILLMDKKILIDKVDDGDEDLIVDAENMLENFSMADNTQEISLDTNQVDEVFEEEIRDEALRNKLSHTDDIIK